MTNHTHDLKVAVATNVFFTKLNFVVLRISMFCVLILSLTQVSLAQIYISKEIRCENYETYPINTRGDTIGSCVFANTITILHHYGHHNLANWIPIHHSGGETHYDINNNLHKWGLKTQTTFSSSKRVLDYAHFYKLPAIISYHKHHSCIFLGWYVNPNTHLITHAYVLNPNHPNSIETPTYTAFMNNWRRNDGEAVVIVP